MISDLGTPPETPSGCPHLKSQVGAYPDRWLAAPAHRPKAVDRPATPSMAWLPWATTTEAPVLNNSHLAPAHRTLQGLLAL